MISYRATTPSTLDAALVDAIARDWIDAWNAHDLERILSHYTDDVDFASPFVIAVTGNGTGRLRGRDALRNYFTAALARYPDLEFSDVRTHLGADSVAIVYTSSAGDVTRSAAEVMILDQTGKAGRVLCHYL